MIMKKIIVFLIGLILGILIMFTSVNLQHVNDGDYKIDFLGGLISANWYLEG